jgi:hypothetical protein
MTLWWTFSILVWATVPPTMHQKYDAISFPVPYKTEAECQSAVAWLNANTPRVPPPSPDTKQIFICVPISTP